MEMQSRANRKGRNECAFFRIEELGEESERHRDTMMELTDDKDREWNDGDAVVVEDVVRIVRRAEAGNGPGVEENEWVVEGEQNEREAVQPKGFVAVHAKVGPRKLRWEN